MNHIIHIITCLPFLVFFGLALLSFLLCFVRRKNITLRSYPPRLARFLAMLAAFALILFAAAPPARAQVTPTTIIQLTNLFNSTSTNMLGAAGAANISNLFTLNTGQQPSNNIIPLRQGQGMAVSATVVGNLSSVTTAGFSINWALSIDGTNWQTAGLLQFSNLPNGVVTNVFTTNFSSVDLNNFQYITPASIEWTGLAGTNLSINNVLVSFGNLVPSSYQ